MIFHDTDRHEPVQVVKTAEPKDKDVEAALLGWISEAKKALRSSRRKRKEFMTSCSIEMTEQEIEELKAAS